MKHTSLPLAAVLVFVIITALAWAGRAAIGTSNVFLGVIVGGYFLAMTLAFPAKMADARAECTAWFRAWKDSSRPPTPPAGDAS